MEEWRSIKSYKGFSISTLGRIKSPRGRILKTHTQKNSDTLWVRLCLNNKTTAVRVLQLMKYAFFENLEPGYELRFKDGNCQNLTLENLEIYNTSEESSNKDYLTKNQLRNLLNSGNSITAISRETGIRRDLIYLLMKNYGLTTSINNYSEESHTSHIEEEIWLPIEEVDNLYEISNMGNVRRIEGGKNLSLNSTSKSNCSLTLNLNGETLVKLNISKLVAKYFMTKPEGYDKVIPIDGNAYNARVNNLKWVKSSYNRDKPLIIPGLTETPESIRNVVRDLETDSLRVVARRHLLSERHIILSLAYYGFPKSLTQLRKDIYYNRRQNTLEHYLTRKDVPNRVKLQEGELIKEVPNFAGLCVTNLGRVISRFNFLSERELTVRNKHGVSEVSIAREGVPHSLSVKKMVAEAFVPNPLNYPKIIPLNRDYKDCRAENLAWVSKETFYYLTLGKGANLVIPHYLREIEKGKI